MRYYQEPDGDYLCVSGERLPNDPSVQEGRATAIAGLITSVCTTGIGDEFLATCKRVPRKQVPSAWIEAMNGQSL